MMLKKALVCSIAAASLVGCDKCDNLSEKQRSEVEIIVKAKIEEILDREPEKFLRAVDLAMQKQQQQAAKKVETAATEQQQKFWESKLVIGNKDAKIKVCVFFDPLEPVSQKFRAEVIDPIAKERSDVGFFLIPVSVYGGDGENGPNSILATQSVIAAAWQSIPRAIALWSKLPPINKEVTKTVLLKIAKEVGLDADKLEKDMDGPLAHETLANNGKLAVEVGIPLQLPVILCRKTDGILDLLPPFVKPKMHLVLDAIRDDKPWKEVLVASVNEQQQEKTDAGNNIAEEKLKEVASEAKPAQKLE